MDLVRPQALAVDRSILTSAEATREEQPCTGMLSWLARWIRDLVLIQVGGDRDQILYLDRRRSLEAYAKQAQTDSLLDLPPRDRGDRAAATRHLNLHMALEKILLRLRDAVLASAPQPA